MSRLALGRLGLCPQVCHKQFDPGCSLSSSSPYLYDQGVEIGDYKVFFYPQMDFISKKSSRPCVTQHQIWKHLELPTEEMQHLSFSLYLSVSVTLTFLNSQVKLQTTFHKQETVKRLKTVNCFSWGYFQPIVVRPQSLLGFLLSIAR